MQRPTKEQRLRFDGLTVLSLSKDFVAEEFVLVRLAHHPE